MAYRNLFFFLFIGLIYFTNIFTCFLNTYIKEENLIFTKFQNSKLFLVVICSFVFIMSICQIPELLSQEYVDDISYPKEATAWIKQYFAKTDDKDIRLWTNFNWGSYLELNGIKVFLDSRSGMYTEQENKGVTVLEDWLDATSGKVDYEKIFEKYNINYALVNNSELINIYISKDENYKLIYQDNFFSLYKKR